MSSFANSDIITHALKNNLEMVSVHLPDADPKHIKWLVEFACMSDNIPLFNIMTREDKDMNKYYLLCLDNSSVNLCKLLSKTYQIDEKIITDEVYKEVFSYVCKSGDTNMFNWLYFHKMDLFDRNLEEYYILSMRNNSDISKILFETGKINLSVIGEKCFYDAFNYGNNKKAIYLLMLGVEIKDENIKLDVLMFCNNYEIFKFYFDFFQVNIKLLLKKQLCYEHLKYVLSIYNDNIDDEIYLSAYNEQCLELLYEKQKPSYKIFKIQIMEHLCLRKYETFYEKEIKDKNYHDNRRAAYEFYLRYGYKSKDLL